MIQRLYIRDFAVVDEIDLAFGSGMNLLTGETGSGKSIIVDAVGVSLGERADSDMVRSGCERALVEAVLDLTDSPEAMNILEEAGYETEEGSIILTREINKTGKSQCRINGRPSTISLVKSITDHLVDTHGQHEHQFLLKPDRHLPVLDAWCGEEAAMLCIRVAEAYAALCALKSELRQLQKDEHDRARNIDLYQFQAREISEANLSPGEDKELLAERSRLANAEKLHAASSAAFELISGSSEERTALDTLSEAVGSLESIMGVDPELETVTESFRAALYQIQDSSRALRAYRDSVEFNPDRLEAVEERLALIHSLSRKYGESIEEILEYGRNLDQRLEALVHSDERSADLAFEIDRAAEKAMKLSEELSEVRRRGASMFAKSVEDELKSLSMSDAVFQVLCERQEMDSTGIDKVEFLISANPGEPPRPLAKIASGGEMSRVMLAIKSAMTAVNITPTLVFDEIDVGVGGRTAEVIGRKLDSLAAKSQVLCITHLPQIASLPGNHFYIEKGLSEGRTVVRVRQLADDERVGELARMLGGANPSETAMKHAAEMLNPVLEA